LWRALGISEIIEEALVVDRAGSAVLESLLSGQDKKFPNFDMGLGEMIAVACWYLWWIRRQRVQNEEVPSTSRCRLSILSITANAAKVSKSTSTQLEVKWTSLAPRQVKLDVDASFHENEAAGAVGAIIQDYQGQFVAASMKYIPHGSSVSMAEAIAMREGLILANRRGFSSIITESDSIDTIDACKGGETWWTGSAAIFVDCMDQVASIGNVSFVHCPREANKTAHELARVCFTDKNSCNWDDEPPSFLLGPLINNVTVL
jgi:ribonuclease HI